MKKYIPGMIAFMLMCLFLILAYTVGLKSLFALPVIVYLQYRLIFRRKKKGAASR